MQSTGSRKTNKSHNNNHSLKDTNSVRFNQLDNDNTDGSDEEQILIQNDKQQRQHQASHTATINNLSGNAHNENNLVNKHQKTRKNTNKQLSQTRSSYPNSNFSNSNTTNARSESNNTQ